jgi:hypothetical protein
MFYPAGTGKDLAVFPLVNSNHVAKVVEYNESRTGRSLINRGYVSGHLNLPKRGITDIIQPDPRSKPGLRFVKRSMDFLSAAIISKSYFHPVLEEDYVQVIRPGSLGERNLTAYAAR